MDQASLVESVEEARKFPNKGDRVAKTDWELDLTCLGQYRLTEVPTGRVRHQQVL